MSVLKIMNVQQSGPQHLRYLLCPFRNSVLNSPFCLPFWKVWIVKSLFTLKMVKIKRFNWYKSNMLISSSLRIWQHFQKKYVPVWVRRSDVIDKFPYLLEKFVKSLVALVKRNQISTWAMWKSDFYAAGLLPVVCQFGREFFRFAWLLSDKNLNALKTSRYKTFPSRLAMAWRLNHLSLYTLHKKKLLPEAGLEPRTFRSRVWRSTIWAIGALL